jgi:hypothetical protein
VVRHDSIANGALIGSGIGAGALWGYVRNGCGPAGYDPECAASTFAYGLLTIVGTATAAGSLIDMAIVKTVYRSRSLSNRSSFVVSPWIGRGTAGLALSLKF